MANARRGKRAPQPKAAFDARTLEALAKSLQTGRLAIDRMTISDDVVQGLRAVIRDTGLVSFHVHYEIGNSRPLLKIGDFPQMKIEDARQLARTVLALAERGVDPQRGLHERLIRELREQGSKWRP